MATRLDSARGAAQNFVLRLARRREAKPYCGPSVVTAQRCYTRRPEGRENDQEPQVDN